MHKLQLAHTNAHKHTNTHKHTYTHKHTTYTSIDTHIDKRQHTHPHQFTLTKMHIPALVFSHTHKFHTILLTHTHTLTCIDGYTKASFSHTFSHSCTSTKHWTPSSLEWL